MELTRRTTDTHHRARLPLLFFIAAILLGLFIRLRLFSEKILLEYDDAITVLVSTAHEGEYAEVSSTGAYPIGAWAPAEAWQRFVEPEAGRGLRQVALDLARYDIHPPLYFWALHLWVSAFGTDLLSVQLFNVLIELLIFTVLLWIGHEVFQSPSEALLLSAAWLLSPIASKTAFWVRQYTFLGLVLLVFFYLLYRCAVLPGRVKLFSLPTLGLALAILAGLFTHFYFLIFLLVGLGLVVYPVVRHGGRRVLGLSVLAFLGAACLLLLYPGFSQSLGNYLEKMSRFNTDPAELVERVKNAVKTLALLFSPAALGLGLLAGGWMWSQKDRRRPVGLLSETKALLSRLDEQPLFRWSLAFSVLPILAILVLYLLGFSPQHAFSSRYLGFISPLIAFIPVLLTARSRRRRWMLPIFYTGLLALGLSTLLPGLTQTQEGWVDRSGLERAQFVVIDSIQWGTWPGIVQYLGDHQEVFVEGQEQLLAHPQAWLARPGSDGFIWVSIVRGFENTRAGREKILDLLSEGYRVELLSEAYRPADWSVRLYRVMPAR